MMKKYMTLKNISINGKMVLKDSIVEIESSEKASLFLEKGFVEELKNEALPKEINQVAMTKEAKKR